MRVGGDSTCGYSVALAPWECKKKMIQRDEVKSQTHECPSKKKPNSKCSAKKQSVGQLVEGITSIQRFSSDNVILPILSMPVTLRCLFVEHHWCSMLLHCVSAFISAYCWIFLLLPRMTGLRVHSHASRSVRLCFGTVQQCFELNANISMLTCAQWQL